MNFVEQGELVTDEVAGFHSFRIWIFWCSFMRFFFPGILPDMVRILFRDRLNVGSLPSRQEQLDLLCSKSGKESRFYEIYRANPYNFDHTRNFHALSEHLEREFPTYAWTALANAMQARLDHLPRLGLITILEFLALIPVSVIVDSLLGLYIIDLEEIRDWILYGDIDEWIYFGFLVFAYLVLFLVISRIRIYLTRWRLRRTLGVLRYMEIRARAGDLHAPQV